MLLRQTEIKTQCVLFDLDGTLVQSDLATVRVYARWARRRGLDPDAVTRCVLGRTTLDNVKSWAPAGSDIHAEAAELARCLREDTEGVTAMPGAAQLLQSIPKGRWAVVTNGDRALALSLLRAAGLPAPRLLIASGDVARGKPSPEGFLLAAKRLAIDPARGLIFEDSRVGVEAARASGARVIAIAGKLSPEELEQQPYITDMRGLTIFADSDQLVLRAD